MNSSRRAARPARGHDALPALRLAAGMLAGATAVLAASVGLIASQLARKVVTPARRQPDTEILSLDVPAQTITLTRTPDTGLPGRYGLFTTGSAPYLKLGSVLEETDTTVKRKLLTQITVDAHLGAAAAFSGWYFDRPEQLQLPFSPQLIGSPLGPCPAWLFPAAVDSGDWVIQVHGRGTTRAEGLRAVPLFRDLGYTSLLISYRNDGEAPRSKTGMYALGATEWRDVDAAVAFARRRGAKRVVVMGWSMGGAIALQLSLTSAHRDLIAAIILDSPVIDWGVVLRYQGEQMHMPRTVVGVALGALGSPWGSSVAGTGDRIPFERLDVVARAAELRHPVLILHSDDDGFVPSDASHDLVLARPDLVDIEIFEKARHTKLWNYDQDRWTSTIAGWLRSKGLVTTPAGEGS